MNGNRPCVSVIVPLFNSEGTLVEALESALTQDLADIEVICVDDGSTDRSAYVVEQLAAVDGRLRLVRQANAGASAARNAGIDGARGAFLTFLDADDRYRESSFLRELYEGAVSSGQMVAAGCFANWRGPVDIEYDFSGTEYDGYRFERSGVVKWEDYQFDYGFHRFLFARGLFEGGRNRFGRLTYFEDPVFLVRILAEAGQFWASSNVHYLYRCEFKPRFWTTPLVLDFLEGAGRNLEFSRRRRLAKLHYYTLRHMEYDVWEMGVGVNPALALDVIDVKLRGLEQLVDQALVEEAGGQPPYTLRLRRALDSAGRFDPVGKAYRWMRYQMIRRRTGF